MKRMLIAVVVAAALAAGVLPVLTSSAAASGDTSVTGLSVTPTSYAAGAADVEYAVSFTTTSALSAGDTVTLTAPAGASFGNDPNLYEVTIGGTGGDAQTVTASGNVADLTIPSGLGTGDAVTIDAYGVSNPASADSGGSFSVATSLDTDSASTALPVTSATKVSSVSASSQMTSEGASDAAWTVMFTTGQAISDGNPGYVNDGAGYIQLAAPTGTVFGSARGDYAIRVGGENWTPGAVSVVGESNVVDISLPADSDSDNIAADTQVTVSAWGVTNPTSSAGSLSVSTSSDAAASPTSASFSSNFGDATQISDVQVTVGASAAGATDVPWIYSFETDQPISDGNDTGNSGVTSDGAGYLELTAPAGSSFATGDGDYDVSYDGNTYNEPGVELDPADAGENVVEIPLGEGWTPIAADTTVTVAAYGNTNPSDANSAAQASAFTSSDTVAQTYSTPIAAATAATAVSSTSTSDAASATGVSHTLSFTTTDAVSAGNPSYADDGGGTITITAPAGTSLPTPSVSFPWVVSDGSNSSNLTSGGSVTISNGNVATISAPFSLPAGDAVTVTIPDVSNAATDPDAPFGVVTSSDSVSASAAIATGLSATAGNASAAVSWTAPDQSGITGYLITPYLGGVAQQVDEISGNGTSTTVGGLTNGSAYTFTVTALIGSAYGPESLPSAAVTPTASAAGGSGGSGGGGTSPTPGFAASTSVLAFGTFAVGQASDSETVTVSSTGTAALTFGADSITGADASDFTISSDSCANQTLAGGATCTVTLVFTPSAGGSASASLSFDDNASESPQSVSLTGSGTTLATITGTVTDAGGSPVSEVYVQVCPYGNVGACSSVYTAQDGSFSLSGLTPGEKMMEVRPDVDNLGDASAIVDAVAGSNEQDFTVAAPVPFSSSLSFNGGSGGTPTSFWTSPDSLTEKLPVLAGKPGTYGVLTLEFMATPAGSGGLQPIAYGELEVAYKYSAAGTPEYLGEQSVDPNGSSIIGSWNLGLTTPAGTGSDASALTAQGVFTPPQDGGLHGELSFNVVHFNEYFATLPAVDGAAIAHSAAATSSSAGAATALLNNNAGTAASASATPTSGAAACTAGEIDYDGFAYLGQGRFLFDDGSLWTPIVDGKNTVYELVRPAPGQAVASTANAGSAIMFIGTQIGYDAYNNGAAGKGVVLFNGKKLVVGASSGGNIGAYDVYVDPSGQYFENEAISPERGRFEFFGNGSVLDTKLNILYDPNGNEHPQSLPTGKCVALSSASAAGATVNVVPEDDDDDDDGDDGDDGGSDYQDPSGIVQTAGHVPVAGAKVTLVRSSTKSGRFTAVKNGSVTMSPGNRKNPDKTNVLGQFGWDVLPGYYRVTAQHKSCKVVKGKGVATETKILAVPPAVVDLNLTLSCPHLTRTATSTKLTAKKVPVSEELLSAHVSGRKPQGIVKFTAGKRLLGVVAVGKGSNATLTVTAARARGARASYEGDGLLKPSRS